MAIKKILNNNSNKHEKQAQHVVELALIMPLLIILFSYAFQLMVETFSKYRFSYVFAAKIKNITKNPIIFNTKEELESFNLREFIEKEAEKAVVLDGKLPYTDIKTSLILAKRTAFVSGEFRFISERILFGQTGMEYFHFILPVNKVYLEPLLLEQSTKDIEGFFNKYYTSNSTPVTIESDEKTEEGLTGGLGGEGENSNSGGSKTPAINNDEGISGSLETESLENGFGALGSDPSDKKSESLE